MPHAKMQQYVNVDYRRVMSIVGLVGDQSQGQIIGEVRYVQDQQRPYGDVAIVVDEQYHGLGLGTFMLKRLAQVAKEKGLQGFTSDVLATNKTMMKVFEKLGLPIKAELDSGVYHLTIPFYEEPRSGQNVIQYEFRERG